MLHQIKLMNRSKFSTLFALAALVVFGVLTILLTTTFGLRTRASENGDRKSSSPNTKSKCSTCSQPTERTIYAPTIGLPEALGSDIVLNCRSTQIMNVTPTFYTADGEAIVGAMFQMQPAEMRFVSIESLIPPEHRSQHVWGGMSLSYTGSLMEMWAQITLRGGAAQGGSADVTFSVLNNLGSDTQEAVWWQPRPGTAVIALGNSSNTPIQTRLKFSNGETQEVQIAPFATRYVRRNSNGGNSNGFGESVKLTTNGAAGSLKATGFVISNDRRYTSGIRFYDTPNAVQPNLFATNFRVKNSSVRLLLKNTSTTSITAQPRFRPMEGNASAVELSPIALAPNEIKELNLQSLLTAAATRTDLDAVSVQIENNGAAGSLIGALYSTNQTTGVFYDVPLRDSGVVRNSTGAYPIRLDDDYKTVVSITNAGNETAQFGAVIRYNGGQYAFSPRTLNIGQTATFDIKRLRDEQTPDQNGNIIPATMTSGQFAWSLIRTPNTTRLVGRSEVVSPSQKVSSSYSCPICCPNNGPYLDSPSLLVDAGSFTSVGVRETWRDCYGYQSDYPTTIPGLQSFDTTIATAAMEYYGMMRADGIAAGDTYWFSDPYHVYEYRLIGQDYCEDIGGDQTASGPIEVAPKIEILRNGQVINTTTAQNVIVGEQINLSATVTGGTPSSYQWTVPGQKVKNYVVTNTSSNMSGTVTELDNTNQQNISYYWVDGGEGRQVRYTATVRGRQYSKTAIFNVKRPTVTVTSATHMTTIYTRGQHQELLFGQISFNSTDGIKFTRSDFQVPSGFSGDTIWVQIIDYAYTRTLNDGQTTQTASGVGLDSAFPYSSNDPNAASTQDSPGVCLRICSDSTSKTKMQTRIDADMYLMFKPSNLPSGESAIYVPLRKVTWNWRAIATRRPDFLFELPSNCCSNSQNPSGVDTTSFPQWTVLVTGNEPYQ